MVWVARGDGLEVEGPAAARPQVLADRSDLALIAVERARMPMVVVDAVHPDQPIVLANQAFLSLTGYDAAAVLGHNCRFLQGPETAAEAIQQLREGVAREETVDVELVNYRRDGSSFWNAVHLSPVRDHDGRLVYYFGSQWDVSERYRAEALWVAQQRLLREIDHRAMNALALVQGFVRLSGRDSVEGFANAVQGRVEVLARAHTLLARTNWADVTLQHVLREEMAQAGEQVTFDGPVVLMPADRVQPFALLIHELASNARRHGALAQAGGHVAISWRPGSSPGVVDLAWRERGGPEPQPGPPGFGQRLISSIVRQQLQGRLRQDWAPEGLTAEVSCRVAVA